ncbi:FAD-binding oxidoreductase [Geodermatophilus sp. SYSU D00684]
MTQELMTQELRRAGFAGALVEPGDPDYDRARAVWNGAVDARPALIARCTSPTDVATALAHAQRAGLEVGVRCGGHHYGGAAVPDGGLTIDLRAMNSVAVDPAARRARCGGGALQAELDAATQEHGLAVTGGTVSHTGVGGLTLGGGIGWLTHACGLAVDNLVSAQVVLADGRCVRASADEHPDLFWALTGGGGNFGVVTEFQFRLHPVGPLVHFGMLFWELERAAAALRAARDVLNALPRDAGGLAFVVNAPPAPFVPGEHHFRPGVALAVVGLSGAAAHAALLGAGRDALPPLFAFTTDMPYTVLQSMLDDAAAPGLLAYNKAVYLDEFSDAAVDAVTALLPRRSSPLSLMPIFPLGGAFTDVDDDATAFGGRRAARYAVNIDAVASDPQALAADREWVRSIWSALRPFAPHTGSYVNFMTEYEQDRVRASYGPAKYERLARIKARYDPGNLLHRNANIRPEPPVSAPGPRRHDEQDVVTPRTDR